METYSSQPQVVSLGELSVETCDLPVHVDWLTVSYKGCRGRPDVEVERAVVLDGFVAIVGVNVVRLAGYDVGRWRSVGSTRVLELSGPGLRLLGPVRAVELARQCLGPCVGARVTRADFAVQWQVGGYDGGRWHLPDGRVTQVVRSLEGETRYVKMDSSVLVREYVFFDKHRRFEVQVRPRGEWAPGGGLWTQVASLSQAARLAAICVSGECWDGCFETFVALDGAAPWVVKPVVPAVPEQNARRGVGLLRRYFERCFDERGLRDLARLENRILHHETKRQDRAALEALCAEARSGEGASGESPDSAQPLGVSRPCGGVL